MSDKHIVVTGANGGIGHQLVDHLISDGYRNITCQYRKNNDNIKKVFEKHDLSFEKHCYEADLTDEQQVEDFHLKSLSARGNTWGLINLVGVSSNAMSWKISTHDFIRVMDANVLTTFLTCRAFSQTMREQKGGRIINTSSIVAYAGTIGAAHYCAAKAAVVGYTKALSLELANKNITANILALGYFNAGMISDLSPEIQQSVIDKTPLKRFGNVSEISGHVKLLLSNESSFTTGQVFHINGGCYL
jgi:NAD(P)-dependent dehydrogenase (short-subunit alcohol dehydrogenase family)